MFESVIVALWAMLPAYVPNNAAVVVGGGRPIDGGHTVGGRRLLGDGKTWQGTVGGTLSGILTGVLLNLLAVVLPIDGLVPTFPLLALLGLAGGAMGGDIGASLVKRRLNRERGSPVPGLDQLDFVVGALICTPILAPGWFFDTFSPLVILIVLVITPLLHLGLNVVAFHLGLKNEPY